MQMDDPPAVGIVDLPSLQSTARIAVEEVYGRLVEIVVSSAQHGITVADVRDDGQEGENDGPPVGIGDVETMRVAKRLYQPAPTRIEERELTTLPSVTNLVALRDETGFDHPFRGRIDRAITERPGVPLQLLHLLAQLISAHGLLG